MAQSEPAGAYVSFVEDIFHAGSPKSQQELMRIAESKLLSDNHGSYGSVECNHVDTSRNKVRVNRELVDAACAILADHGPRIYRPLQGETNYIVLHRLLKEDPRWAELTVSQAKRALTMAKRALRNANE